MKFTLDLSLVSAGQDLGGELEEKSPVMAQYGTVSSHGSNQRGKSGTDYHSTTPRTITTMKSFASVMSISLRHPPMPGLQLPFQTTSM